MAKGHTYKGTNGDDVISGGKGDDQFFDRHGNDVYFGGKGNDRFSDAGGADEIHGGDGDDLVGLGEGHNTFFGDAGSDVIYDGVGFDTIDGGSGFDSIIFSDLMYAISIDLQTGAVRDSYGHGETVTSVESVFATRYDDVIRGTNADEVFRGSRGSDILFGGGGADTFVYGKVANYDLFDDLYQKFDPVRYQDTILDFQSGSDSAPIDRLDLSEYAAAFGPITWVGDATPMRIGELGFAIVDGDTIVSLELNPKLPGAEFTIKLDGVVDLHASNVVLDAGTTARPESPSFASSYTEMLHPLGQMAFA